MRGIAVKRFTNYLVRQRWLLIAFPIVAGSAFLVAAPQGEGAAVWLIALLAFAALVLSVLVLNLAGHDPEAEEVAALLLEESSAQALVARWLRRSRYYRFVGGATGFVTGVGFVDNGNWVPVLLSSLAGVAIGGMLAEVHVLRRRSSSARSAGLTARRVGDYVKRADQIALVALGCAALLSSVAGLVVDTADQANAIRWGVVALIAVASAGALQRLVTIRQRPGLSPQLRQADDLLRHLAATQGFTRPTMALSAALLAESVNSLGTEGVYSGIALLLWLLGIGWYLSSRQDRAHLAGRPAASA
jgi:hypothetical protein